MTQISIVVPAYREAKTIAESLHRLVGVMNGLGKTYEVIVVSDGNTDGTAEIARSQGLPHVRILHYPQNEGKGYALRHGTESALGELVAFIDADLDIHPEGIVRFVEMFERGDIDAIVASKIHPESQVSYPAFRRLQSRVFRVLVKLLFRLEVSDTQTGLKLFRKELLDVCLPQVTTSGFAFDLELLVLANDAGYRIVEGPLQIDFKFSSTTGSAAVFEMLKDIHQLQRRRAGTRHVVKSARLAASEQNYAQPEGVYPAQNGSPK